jgi:hypothetical protein
VERLRCSGLALPFLRTVARLAHIEIRSMLEPVLWPFDTTLNYPGCKCGSGSGAATLAKRLIAANPPHGTSDWSYSRAALET